jgi:hypothetical protein
VAKITRADKIRMAQEAAAAAAAADTRDPAQRDDARREWGAVRKAAREAFIQKGDWKKILDDYRNAEGYYTPDERAIMCSAYAEELISNAAR